MNEFHYSQPTRGTGIQEANELPQLSKWQEVTLTVAQDNLGRMNPLKGSEEFFLAWFATKEHRDK